MGTEIILFSKESFIEASMKFVCVRLGSYESKEHQDMVRDLLRGTFQNTAFVVYAPDGKTTLSRSGRSPNHAFGRNVEAGMAKIADKYPAKAPLDKATITDFHSFKQSLNVAAADQRLLVYSAKAVKMPKNAKQNLQDVFNDPEVRGRYFFDEMGKDDKLWNTKIKGETEGSGIFIIRPGKYGTDGVVVKKLAWDATVNEMKTALKNANTEYAKTEQRKVYSEHVSAGRKDGVDYKNTMPPGEDRDGDGKIDPRPDREGRERKRPPRRP